tara:strand:- start:227 stop:370 length:144 start_codon:yes stop_codon:yes gene_type:complete
MKQTAEEYWVELQRKYDGPIPVQYLEQLRKLRREEVRARYKEENIDL